MVVRRARANQRNSAIQAGPVSGAARRFSIRAYLADVQAAVKANSKYLVDVRSPQEFSGEILAPPGLPETCQRGGHIPHARNIPWGKTANEDGTFKTADEIKAIYDAEGVPAIGRSSRTAVSASDPATPGSF